MTATEKGCKQFQFDTGRLKSRQDIYLGIRNQFVNLIRIQAGYKFNIGMFGNGIAEFMRRLVARHDQFNAKVVENLFYKEYRGLVVFAHLKTPVIQCEGSRSFFYHHIFIGMKSRNRLGRWVFFYKMTMVVFGNRRYALRAIERLFKAIQFGRLIQEIIFLEDILFYPAETRVIIVLNIVRSDNFRSVLQPGIGKKEAGMKPFEKDRVIVFKEVDEQCL